MASQHTDRDLEQRKTAAPWYVAIGLLSPIAATLACRTVPGLPGTTPVLSTIAVAILVIVGAAATRRPLAFYGVLSAGLTAAGTWSTVAHYTGITAVSVVVLLVGVVAFTVPLTHLPTVNPEPEPAPAMETLPPGRTEQEEQIQALIRRITKRNPRVKSIKPWEVPEDGIDIHVDLPEDMTADDLAGFCDKIASAPLLRLPQGCLVSVLDGEYQCEAIIRIMTRDCLKDLIMLDEPVSPASINDEFPIMRSPQGSWFMVCLRIASMIVGGTTGSGKTTLLDRIIAYLVRCTDALIWIVDFNGGGLGAPWNEAYEQGLCRRPAIDWLADTDHESAVLMACAKGVAFSRKSDRECVALRKAANTKVLPVSAKKPAVVVITDEGGEVRKAVSILGQIVCENISSLAQVGRAEGLRVVMSVLRGTADLLDKGLRSVCSIRVCLRMNEQSEYSHVLDLNPGKTRLVHKGSSWIFRTEEDYRPLLGRSVDVAPDFITRHSIATSHLRPELDEAGQRICQNITLRDVFDGRDPNNFEDLLDLPSLVDVAEGRAYSGRHDRRRARLEAIERGENPDGPITRKGAPVGPAPVSDVTARFLGKVDKMTRGKAKPAAGRQQTSTEEEMRAEFDALTDPQHFRADAPDPLTTGSPRTTEPGARGNPDLPTDVEVPETSNSTLRERLDMMLRDQYPNGLRAGEIEQRLTEQGTRFSRGNLFNILKDMVKREEADHPAGDQRYYHHPLV
jgi:hypothetical protein